MCAICGIFPLRRRAIPNKEQIVKGMCDLMTHRGPDDEGYYFDEEISLGHRRLRIIDLYTGKQPMSSEDGSLWLIYNGRIYNYPELREDLKKKGHQFRTSSDTEVIIHLYEEKGLKAFSELNGMFAFALWDKEKKELILARDRLGIKPLYYTIINETLVFASEIKALFRFDGVLPKVNEEAIRGYFAFLNTFGSETLFKDIFHLKTGHYMVCNHNGIKIEPYWEMEFREDYLLSESEAKEYLQDLIMKAFKRVLISDVPLGSHLSGGLDSSLIVGIVSQTIPNLPTFTCGFDTKGALKDEIDFDERSYANIISTMFSTTHYELMVTPADLPQKIPKIIWHLDEPKVNSSLAQYCIMEKASQHVRVILGGEGADEFLGGYPWRHGAVVGSQMMEGFEFNYWFNHIFMRDIIHYEEILFTPEFRKRMNSTSPYDQFREEVRQIRADTYLNRAFGYDAKKFLHGLLIQADKVGMAHSIEGRFPFLDNELIDFFQKIPGEYKLNINRGDPKCKLTCKKILRDIAKKWLPQEIITKKKIGIVPPEGTWYKSHLRDYIERIILDDRTIARGYFSKEGIKYFLHRHYHDQGNFRKLIWALLNFELWQRIFIEQDSSLLAQIREGKGMDEPIFAK